MADCSRPSTVNGGSTAATARPGSAGTMMARARRCARCLTDVTLPHDWAVTEPFSEHSSGGGYLAGGGLVSRTL